MYGILLKWEQIKLAISESLRPKHKIYNRQSFIVAPSDGIEQAFDAEYPVGTLILVADCTCGDRFTDTDDRFGFGAYKIWEKEHSTWWWRLRHGSYS